MHHTDQERQQIKDWMHEAMSCASNSKMLHISTPRHAGKSQYAIDIETLRGLDVSELEQRFVAATMGKPADSRRFPEYLALHGSRTGRIASYTPNPSNIPKEAPNMNPTTIKTVTVEHSTTQRVEIENTKWFDANTTEPGQPGVFRVNAVVVADGAEGQERFSYFNGKSFGPVKLSVDAAYTSRFDKSALASTITHFQGLKEQA